METIARCYQCSVSQKRYIRRIVTFIKALILIPVFGLSPSFAAALYVDTLDLSHATEGWNQTLANRSIDGNPLTVGGMTYTRGIGTHSDGLLAISLQGRATRFTAMVGVDDEVINYAPHNRSKVQFIVADEAGRTLFDQTLGVRSHPRVAPIDIEISGVQTLYLLSGSSDDTFEYDHADWLDVKIHYSGNPPVSIALASPENPLIAPPQEEGKPRINGPKVVGIRTGTPLIHTIAASGSRPLRFSASNLPFGVTLESNTGRLNGTISSPGRHSFDVTVSNSLGTASRNITLVFGENLALTPPMGWNSYDSYGDSVTEDEILANARYVRDNLLPFGWDTVVVDYRWYDETPIYNGGGENDNLLTMDQFGRLQPALNRFPSAAGGRGFAPLAEQIHAMGLRFGIHIMRGIPQDAVHNFGNSLMAGSTYTLNDAANPNSNCRWLVNEMYGVRSTDTQTYYGTCYSCSVLNPSSPATPSQMQAGYDWYRSIVDQYADWGVDYIKADDMSSGGGRDERPPYSQGEIDQLSLAMASSSRSMTLSLSPGETPVAATAHLNNSVNMWRMSDDFWDRWGDVQHMFSLAKRWQGKGSVGHWPDADMLPFGYLGPRCPVEGYSRITRFTKNEQVTVMSLWAILPSPYMLGANLTRRETTDDLFTKSLLTNSEVLDIHQDAGGMFGNEISLGLIEGWKRKLHDGSYAVALFNRSDIPKLTRHVTFSELDLEGSYEVRNVWKRELADFDLTGINTEISAHGAQLLKLIPQ